MKIRNGLVSNSSSSSFIVYNPPNITNIEDLANYLQVELNEKTRKEYEYILALFQQKQKHSKKEIIELLANALEDGIPFFDQLFSETFKDEYESSVINFMIHNYEYGTEEFNEFHKMLLNPLIKDFVKHTWTLNLMTVLNTCNKQIKIETDKDYKKFIANWNRENKAITQIFKILAEFVYEKLKEEDMLDSLLVFEVGDNCYMEIEQGYYFENVNNIVRISNH